MDPSNEDSQWLTLLGLGPDAGTDDICRQFECLGRELAPQDFGKLPLYARPTSALPPEFTKASRHCHGWTHRDAYHWVKPHLPRDRGYGPVLIVRDVGDDEDIIHIATGMRAVYAARGEQVPLDELIRDVRELRAEKRSIADHCCILVHELSHAIDDLAAGVYTDWLETFGCVLDRPWMKKALGDGMEKLVAVRDGQQAPPPADTSCHGARFVRILIHLDYRLQTLGVEMKSPLAAERYGHAPYRECFEALGDEPEKFVRESFRKILTRPLPAAFAACMNSNA